MCFLRTAERVMAKGWSFRAETFEELFRAKKIPWEEWIPSGHGKIWVAKASSSKASCSALQSIMKKGHGGTV